MATTPTAIAKSARGIVRTLDGYILQNETITTSPIAEQTPDQMGAIADEQVYDHRADLSLTAVSASATRTAPATENDQIVYDGKTWQVDTVEEAGTYNSLLRFNIRAHRYDNFPAAAAATAEDDATAEGNE